MQPRFQINLLKIPTTKGHQTLQPINKLMYNKHKAKGHDQHFVLLPSFTRSRVQHKFCRTVGLSYSLQIYFVTRFTDIKHPKARFNTTKTQLHTGAGIHRMEIKQHGTRRLIFFNFSLQKDTRIGNQA